MLLIDEIEALVGDALLSVLRQLRAGYARRPNGFPQSIALCGVRDMDDYRVHSLDGAPVLTGGSPFNIVAKSLRLGDFSRAETSALLMQHTAETGQAFDQAALDAAWAQTRGQPWLWSTHWPPRPDSPKDTVGEERVVSNLDSSLQRTRASHNSRWKAQIDRRVLCPLRRSQCRTVSSNAL